MIEKVNPSHPDKLADRIAGAITDLAYQKSENPKVAVEVLMGHGLCHIINETSEHFSHYEIEMIVRRITREELVVDYSEYRQDSHLSDNQKLRIRCGDNGIFRGVPVTEEQKELSRIARRIYEVFPTDGKYILDLNQKRLVICQSNASSDELSALLHDEYPDFRTAINPLGFWTGGLNTDSGATNRKLGSDMGDSVTGGGLWGKDLSKADISLNLYAWNLAQRTGNPVEILCAIGDESVVIQSGSEEFVKPFEEIVHEVKVDIMINHGGFERFAEWGYF
jgi:S-adenosylmethionine synthetase